MSGVSPFLQQRINNRTGALELAGAIGLLIPRLCGLAALGLAGVMVGAIVIHLSVLPSVTLALIPALLVVVFGLVAWGRRAQTKALVGRFTDPRCRQCCGS
ncbi:MAG: DoxX family protein [Pseudonocardiaceae bacterium]